MGKKERQLIAGLVGFAFLAVILLNYSKFANVYAFWGTLLFGIIVIPVLVERMLPAKKSPKKNTPRKSASTKKSTAKNSLNGNKKKYGVRSDDEIISLPLRDLNGYEFERLCYLYFKAMGYNPEITPPAQDKGVDLILTDKKEKFKIAVQCKHYINSGRQITVKEIRELVGAKRNHRCIKGWFIATTTYTNAALAEADTHHIDCFAIEFVENKIVAWKEREVVKRQAAAAKK
ncbi:restriction endonuclease [Anoxybacillus flavithermus NBRC 109594]|uniref:Restriction endonuclease n=1 Tax=Anoxybacillus flavithermus NBRC 109594 TaxID=1315967 RepID=R4G294_9BACL|nr:restriction endonuclease [Anoxybacillus flavithermus]GAC92334.1 restriction endonuclease [Anoxybacillus flavithermus NBRC 109594]